ncbi:melanopsin [Biomphalaria pfeifferi]|uniref:Melanopsin n=1 Tax=Biomphalaria pfeifferi TaxID=112525 RepID=A0AAD8B409_BIOPF|nr:melanopsin [Biomphalaria pfeifferi]
MSSSRQTEILSYFESIIVVTVNRVGLSTVLGITGVVSNVFNVCVFFKQGLQVSMNVNFFVMSSVDVLRSLNYIWVAVCANPDIDKLDTDFRFQDVQYLINGWVSSNLARSAMFIVAFMSFQRYIFIYKPMSVEQVFTSMRSVLVLIFILLMNSIVVLPICVSVYFDWSFNLDENRTMLGLMYRNESSEAWGLSFTMHAVLNALPLSTIVIFTFLLILQIEFRSKWRQDTLVKVQHQAISKRDKRTSKIVTFMAIFLIVSCTPIIALSLATTIVPDFSAGGKQANLYFAVWSFAFLSGVIGANINIFCYYKLSFKYREIFLKMFNFCPRKPKISTKKQAY